MKITKFDIRNFKGIDHTTIHLTDENPGNVGTLIGLNESGKTTILEALSHFVTEDKDTASLVRTVHQKTALHDIIPKDKKAAFTGMISIKATVSLDESDVQALSKALKEDYGLTLDAGKLKREITVDRCYQFEDSSHKETHTYWSPSFYCKTSRGKKFKVFTADRDNIENRKVWVAGIDVLRTRLPKIVYFPTFLFDFPDRIYLEGDESDTNLYYKQVIQDVLDSQGESLTVQKHIVDRIAKLRELHPIAATFMAFLFGKDEKKQIDAVLQKAANKMSEVIFGSWNQILGKNVTGKRVQIDWLLDGDKENSTYLEIAIVDDPSTFSLSERSLGFRWFFSFLLFTQLRRNRKDDGATIFLFDEPAANLHSKAQIKLIESFSRIAHGATYIIYSTHSHYMVNPLWLEKAYIVENKATDYDNEDDVGSFAVRKTDVSAVRYKTFVGANPTKTTYFQPVLDALDISFSPLVRSSRALIVEGKNDFFPVVFLRGQVDELAELEIFPGNGASTASCLISLFRGWGVDFRVMLDDDLAGRQAKKKYMNDLHLKDYEVLTLGEINPDLLGKEFESIFQSDLVEEVKKTFSVARPTKKHFSLFFQELLSSADDRRFPDTQLAFKPISDWIDREFPNKI